MKNLNLKIFLMLILLVVLSNTVVADNSDYALSCCVPRYFSMQTPQPIPLDSSDLPCAGNFIKVNNCCYYDDLELEYVFIDDVLEDGCCCNAEELITFDSLSGKVTKMACESPDYDYEFKETQSGSCDYTNCETLVIPDESDTYNITGNVFTIIDDEYFDNEQIPLMNAQCYLYKGDESLPRTTNETGGFSYIDIFEGNYNFAVYDYELETDEENYTCSQEMTTIDLTENKRVNIELDCVAQEGACEPEWQEGPWGDCEKNDFLGISLRTRTVTLINQCYGDLTNKPISYEECNTANFGLCGTQNSSDVTINEDESCDIICENFNETSGTCLDTGERTSVFNNKSDSTHTTYVNSLTCEDYLGSGSGDIKCSPTCQLDLTACESVCTNDCKGGWQCDDCPAACEGQTDICLQGCENIFPMFLRNDSANIQKGSLNDPYDDLFLMYDSFIEPDLFPGIKFTEGTRNVELNWDYNASCRSLIDKFLVKVTKFESGSVATDRDVSKYYTGLVKYKNITNIIEEGYTYCFDVCTVTKDGTENCLWENKNNAGGSNPYIYGICLNMSSANDFCMTSHEPGATCDYGLNRYIYCDWKSISKNTQTNDYVNLKVFPEPCNNTQVCVESEYNINQFATKKGAECVSAGPCEKCNGLFGLFANYDLTVLDSDDNKFMCEDAQLLEIPFDLNDLNRKKKQIGLCYKDESLTVAPKFNSCQENIHTCYDYKSEAACNNDPCNHFTTDDGVMITDVNCEWSEYNNELGIGVCRPKAYEDQICNLCDTDSPIGYCNEDLCQNNYGSDNEDIPKCYFRDPTKENSNKPYNFFENVFGTFYGSREKNPTCIAREDMGCVMYTDPEDCIGTNQGQGIEVDTTYNVTNQEYLAVDGFWDGDFVGVKYGTNEITTYSDDYFSFGTCQWDDFNGYCYKNPTDNNETNLEDTFSTKKKEDCIGSSDEKKCVIDNTPPVTNFSGRYLENINDAYKDLPVYGMDDIFEMIFEVKDDYWFQGDSEQYNNIVTYITFIYNGTNEDQNCRTCIDSINEDNYQNCYNKCGDPYPNKEKREISSSDFRAGTGIYLMRFFSQDAAYNIEKVNEEYIYMDVTAPEIDFNTTQKIFEYPNDIYKTDLTVYFNTSELAYCSATLINLQNLNEDYYLYGDITKQFNETFDTVYKQLSDGTYNLSIVCKDVFGTENEVFEQIAIDGDKSIYGAKPTIGVYKDGSVLMSVNTVKPAECKFDVVKFDTDGALIIPSYDSMRGTFNSEEFQAVEIVNGDIRNITDETTASSYHSITLSDAASQISEVNVDSKYYSFFTGCKFIDNEETTVGDRADMIMFTIDQLAPYSQIKYQGDVYREEDVAWTNEKEFEVECTDDVDDNGDSYGINSGCKEVNYCFTDNNLIFYDSEFLQFVQHNDVLGLHYYCKNDEFINESFSDDKAPIYGDDNDCSNCYLLYYSTDKLGHAENIDFINPKIRDISFNKPRLYVDDIVIEPEETY